MGPDLDDWLPEPQVRTLHRQAAQVEADALWRAAETVQVCDAATLGSVVRWRVPGTPRDRTFRELFSRYPFTVLAEGERSSVSGLCGHVWTLRRDYPSIEGPDDFCAWDEPGTVRVVFAHWVEPDGDGGATIHSESRVKPVDRRAAMRMRALWALVGRFERFIGGEALRLAARRAESEAGG